MLSMHLTCWDSDCWSLHSFLNYVFLYFIILNFKDTIIWLIPSGFSLVLLMGGVAWTLWDWKMLSVSEILAHRLPAVLGLSSGCSLLQSYVCTCTCMCKRTQWTPSIPTSLVVTPLCSPSQHCIKFGLCDLKQMAKACKTYRKHIKSICDKGSKSIQC